MSSSKSRIFTLVILVLLLSTVFAIFRSRDNNSTNQPTVNKVKIAASFYPLAEFSKNVGRDKVEVTKIVPSGVEVHDFEPTPGDIVKINEADIFIFNGNGLDPWAEDLINNGELDSVKIINASSLVESIEGESHEHENEPEHEDHEDEEALDPHFWLDPTNVIKIVTEIENNLIEVDNANKAIYETNAKNYIDKLESLDNKFESELKGCQLNEIVTSHNAFGYMAKRYGFNIIAITGLSPEAEPTPGKIAEIIDIIKARNIDIIFYESAVNSSVADVIAKETGAKAMVLNPIESLTDEQQNNNENYLSLMETNLNNLKEALKCNL